MKKKIAEKRATLLTREEFIAESSAGLRPASADIAESHSENQRRSETGATLTHEELLAAVKEGARLRLRPKVMTVATTVAGLLPIFWSTRTGVEVMQPLAAPVVGGMLSSLVHILVVTPVIFTWLRERELGPVEK